MLEPEETVGTWNCFWICSACTWCIRYNMHTYRHTFLRLLPRKKTHSEHRPVSGLNIIGMFKSFGESPAEVVFLTTKPGHFFVGHPKLLSENRRHPRCFIFFTGRRMGLPFEHNRVRKSIIPESMKFARTEPGYRILEAINWAFLKAFTILWWSRNLMSVTSVAHGLWKIARQNPKKCNVSVASAPWICWVCPHTATTKSGETIF